MVKVLLAYVQLQFQSFHQNNFPILMMQLLSTKMQHRELRLQLQIYIETNFPKRMVISQMIHFTYSWEVVIHE